MVFFMLLMAAFNFLYFTTVSIGTGDTFADAFKFGGVTALAGAVIVAICSIPFFVYKSAWPWIYQVLLGW